MSKRTNKEVIPGSPEDKDSKKIKMEASITMILTEIRGLKEVMTSTNETVNSMAASIIKLSTDFKTLGNNFKKIESEITIMKTAMEKTEVQLNSVQQLLLRTSFVITGLPPTTPGEVFLTTKKIFKGFKLTVIKEDFKNLYIVQHRNKKGSHICGTFYSEKKRDDAFNLFKASRLNEEPVLTESIFEDLPSDSPFKGRELRLRSQLTQYTKHLLDQARTLKDRFRFIWETEGRILVKQNDGKTVQIHSSLQVAQLMTSTPIDPILVANNAKNK